MLDLMRKHAKSWFIKVALGGIIVTFVLFFGWSGTRERPDSYVAKVNDTIITPEELERVYQNELEALRARFKGTIPVGLLEKLDLKRKVAEELIRQNLLLQEAKRLGLTVSDEELARDIRSMPIFQRNGVFDESLYRSRLSAMKMSPQMFEITRRNQILEMMVIRLLTDSVKIDPEEIKNFWHFENDKLVLSFLRIKPQVPTDDHRPDVRELQAFFKDHQSAYEIPAALRLQYVIISWQDIQNKIDISDEEALLYYQNNLHEFNVPERIHVRHILFRVPPGADQETIDSARKKAEEALARIKAGEDFEKVAEQVSEDEATRERGGDLGFFSKGTMSPQLESAIAKLDVGQVSDPVFTDQGFHLISLLEKKAESQLDFELAKPKIRQKLTEERARAQVSAEADKFYEQVYRSFDLERPAKNFGYEVRIADQVTRADGIPDVDKDPKIMEEAFELNVGDVSKLFKVGEKLVVFKILEKRPARVPQLSEIQERLEADYRKDQALQKVRKQAETIIAELTKPETNADEVAQRYGLTWEQLDPVYRTSGFIPKFGNIPEVQEILTTLSPTAPVFGMPVPLGNDVAVVRLVSVERGSEERYAKEAIQQEARLRGLKQRYFLDGWLKVMERRSKVELNERML